MEEVATEGRYPYRRADFLLEDLPADAQQKYLSVSPGDVLEPIPHGDGFELCRIIKKIEPRLDDPMVKSRVDQRLLEQYFSDLTTKYTYSRLRFLFQWNENTRQRNSAAFVIIPFCFR